jgi:DNA polymerase (family 10)
VGSAAQLAFLPDGRLDYDDGVLAQLDYFVSSVHSAMSQDERAMTARIIRALESPRTTTLGHLTGRLLLKREGYQVDAGKVVDAAIRCGLSVPPLAPQTREKLKGALPAAANL